MATTVQPPPAGQLRVVHDKIIAWYRREERPLPWRTPDCSAWGVLLSEVMSQQTPVARVAPIWIDWMQRWPTPADLAAAAPGEAVRHWGRLGYPRRALRLHAAATAIAQEHDNVVPSDPVVLQSLPGIGSYTAAAVAAFAYGVRTVVVDTNVRRVEARLFSGDALAAPSLTAAESRLAAAVLPEADVDAAVWNVAVMELGAVVCTATGPKCGACPVLDQCAWQRAGAPPYDGPARKGQKWAGTDRQVRGKLLQALRDADQPLPRSSLDLVWSDAAQRDRCLVGLIEDGLVEPLDGGLYSLPS
ncbi:A/G-specific adenine glycosylase [Yimella sp. cx-573]|nr:A/G-specific adenine glycosylase [Yimella sp. cx-573]